MFILNLQGCKYYFEALLFSFFDEFCLKYELVEALLLGFFDDLFNSFFFLTYCLFNSKFCNFFFGDLFHNIGSIISLIFGLINLYSSVIKFFIRGVTLKNKCSYFFSIFLGKFSS